MNGSRVSDRDIYSGLIGWGLGLMTSGIFIYILFKWF